MLKKEITKNTQVLRPVVTHRFKNFKEVHVADENKK